MEIKCQNLTITQRNKLIKSSHRFEEFFDVTLGTWKKYQVEFELKEDTKPICS